MTKLERAAVALIEVLCEQLQRSEKQAEELEQKLTDEMMKSSSVDRLKSEIHVLRTANEEQARRLREQTKQADPPLVLKSRRAR